MPITPSEIINKYKNKIFKINFIISDFKKKKLNSKKKNCIIMDNGTNLLSEMIKKNIPFLTNMKDVNFYVNIKSFNEKIKKIISYSKILFLYMV